MKKVDLHTHSKYSKKPTEWFLKRIGAAESYTEPENLYKILKNRGMDFVTITDHNNIKGCLKLKEKYQDDTFISVESTATFPEDGCKVHILIYDIDENIFREIENLRNNIYDLRDFLIANEIAHSVAHPVYSVNNKLTVDHVEKLLVLFNTFEGINACRSAMYNDKFIAIIKSITQEKIDYLSEKHHIEPKGKNYYKKTITSGSDDHSGLMLGKGFTYSKTAKDINDFIKDLKNGDVFYEGESADFYTIAFNIYKIAYEYSQKNKTISMTGTLLEHLIENISENRKETLWQKFKMKRFRKKSTIHNMFVNLLEELKTISEENVHKRFEIVFNTTSDIADELIKNVFKKLKNKKSSIDSIYKSITASLPGIFITVPFISSFRLTFKDHQIINDLSKNLLEEKNKIKKIAWFTDTISDLNGVSVIVRTIGYQALKNGFPLVIYGSLTEDEISSELPSNFVNLTPIADFKLPYYSHLKIKIPSLMKSLKIVGGSLPDEIYISTPGPVGILGLIIGKILNIKTIGIYHTDFTKEIFEISNDESLANLVERYINFFYNSIDEVKSTSKEYLEILRERGISNCIDVFYRGVDTEIFQPIYKLSEPNLITLIYAGRISKDKNIDFLMDIYFKLLDLFSDIHIRLLLIGDGPYKEKAETKYKHKRIKFLGRIKNKELTNYYNMGDLLVFPSTTDTFGMVVLEAQACGLPAIVSDIGGPKEIIVDGKSGFVARANDLEDWLFHISNYIKWKLENNHIIESMRYESLNNVQKRYNWKNLLGEIFYEN